MMMINPLWLEKVQGMELLLVVQHQGMRLQQVELAEMVQARVKKRQQGA